jgi:antimicrobial peptide system SdpA family protein
MNPEDTKQSKRVGLFLWAILTFVAVVGVYAAHPPLPHNAIHLPYEDHIDATLFLPEGWKFFTRDPQDEAITYFERAGNGWVVPANTPNGRMANYFGASRDGRGQSVELGRVISSVPKSAWHECDALPTACLDRLETGFHLTNTNRRPLVCGTIGVALQKPIPWAWSAYDPPVVMPSHVIRLEITC